MFFPILRGQWWLFVGACVSLAIALLHVVVVLIGPDAYSFFGGPGLARQAEGGSWQPALMTLVLAWLFVAFAAYGLSGAGVIRRLPLLAGMLLLIGSLDTFRGLSVVGQIGQYLGTPRQAHRRWASSPIGSSPSWPVSATSAGRSKAGST